MNQLQELTSHLTTSGWILFGWTTAVALGFLIRVVAREWRGAAAHAFVLGIQLVWMLWLVTV